MAFYYFQGSLPAGALCYIERPADQALLAALEAGEFAYLLTSRQMGKSSLLTRARERLLARGYRVVCLDLMGAGTSVTPEQWYDGLVMAVGQQLNLGAALDDFWLDHQRLGPAQRWFAALRDVVLPRLPPGPDGTPARLVIFIDELDTVGSLPFYADEFFNGIRECYNARVQDAQFERVSFCLVGVVTLAQLIRDRNTTPFLIGQRIELEDFSPGAMEALRPGLGQAEPVARALLSRVFDWTHGHPYLTQRLCKALADRPEAVDPREVDVLCHQLFFTAEAREQEPNLLFVRERLLQSGSCREEVLRLYERIRRGQAVPDREGQPAIEILLLSGIVRVERGLLVVRNRVYAEVFNEPWLRFVQAAAGQQEARALAVMPFTDQSAEPLEFLADGLTDELIRRLGQVPGLRVVSRESVFQFRGRVVDPRQLGFQLGASLLLRGGLRRLGLRVQVNMELVETQEGAVIWSVTHRHGAEDWSLLQEDLVRSVVEQLGARRQDAVGVALAHVPRAHHVQAHNLYLKGLHQLHLRSEVSLKRSLVCFQGALAIEPAYAAALAGSAAARILLGVYNLEPPQIVYPQAREAAIRALELDESTAEAHCALASINAILDRDWPSSESRFRRAIELNPSYATAAHWLATMCLTPLGRHDEALAMLRQAQQLDPLSASIPAATALSLHFAGRPDEAVAQAQLALEMDEDFWLPHQFLGWIHEAAERFDQAGDALQTAVTLSHSDPSALASLGHLFGVQGRAREALEVLDRLQALGKTRYVPPAEVALVWLGLGRWEEARMALDKARLDRSFRMIYARVDPRFRPAREQPALAVQL